MKIVQRPEGNSQIVQYNLKFKIDSERQDFIKTFNTVFRQAFLLIQYSFICKQYFFCSDREYQYFFDRW